MWASFSLLYLGLRGASRIRKRASLLEFLEGSSVAQRGGSFFMRGYVYI